MTGEPWYAFAPAGGSLGSVGNLIPAPTGEHTWSLCAVCVYVCWVRRAGKRLPTLPTLPFFTVAHGLRVVMLAAFALALAAMIPKAIWTLRNGACYPPGMGDFRMAAIPGVVFWRGMDAGGEARVYVQIPVWINRTELSGEALEQLSRFGLEAVDGVVREAAERW